MLGNHISRRFAPSYLHKPNLFSQPLPLSAPFPGSFPSDVLWKICQNVRDIATLASLSRTTHHLRSLSDPYLYGSVPLCNPSSYRSFSFAVGSRGSQFMLHHVRSLSLDGELEEDLREDVTLILKACHQVDHLTLFLQPWCHLIYTQEEVKFPKLHHVVCSNLYLEPEVIERAASERSVVPFPPVCKYLPLFEEVITLVVCIDSKDAYFESEESQGGHDLSYMDSLECLALIYPSDSFHDSWIITLQDAGWSDIHSTYDSLPLKPHIFLVGMDDPPTQRDFNLVRAHDRCVVFFDFVATCDVEGPPMAPTEKDDDDEAPILQVLAGTLDVDIWEAAKRFHKDSLSTQS